MAAGWLVAVAASDVAARAIAAEAAVSAEAVAAVVGSGTVGFAAGLANGPAAIPAAPELHAGFASPLAAIDQTGHAKPADADPVAPTAPVVLVVAGAKRPPVATGAVVSARRRFAPQRSAER